MKNKEKQNLIKGEIYEIEWVDIYVYSSWFTDEEIDNKLNNPNIIVSVGYFVKKNKEYFVIAMGKETTGDSPAEYGGLKFIPHGCIKKIRKLKRLN